MREPQTDSLPYDRLRGLILANAPLANVAAYAEAAEPSPWFHFVEAHRLESTDGSGARQHLRDILELPDLETRTSLQAWHCLRELGVHPDDETARQVQGIVVEVGLESGLDSVAAYKDHSARYYNHSGAAVIWDADLSAMNAHIDPLLDVAEVIGQNTKPLEGDHPTPPPIGGMLINILTPGGIHIGMGPMKAMQDDPMGSAVTQTALGLMQALIAATEQNSESGA